MELLKHSNVNNLTELWKVGGLLAGKFISENEVFASLGSQGDWPDKVWITGSLNSKKLLAVQSLSKGKPLVWLFGKRKSKKTYLPNLVFIRLLNWLGCPVI